MSTSNEVAVMRLALEALNKLTDAAGGFSVSGVYFNEGVWEQECLNAAYDAIKVLEEALAQSRSDVKQEQSAEHVGEPAAWICNGVNNTHDIDFDENEINDLPVGTLLYTTPQQRTWVGLTDDEREQHRDEWRSNIHDQEIFAISAKLKAKNERLEKNTRNGGCL